ncbi:MAG: DUF763 domain-containing protein, partial [Crenarchaeota archaeon]|nr:DUF763 domain-containing protein [Thermoproteota archaeon]
MLCRRDVYVYDGEELTILSRYSVNYVEMGVSGIADLPLHDGYVPRWLFERMKKLSYLIINIMLEEFGPRETLRRFSNPVFFQAFNNIIGMDWDSSGSTTVTCAVLRESINRSDLPIRILGGKGKLALKVPEEIDKLPERFNIEKESLKTISRLVAKVDNVALQDGYQLYHHSIMVSEDGSWVIVQQGMNPELKLARRYHWWMDTTFIRDPHSGICGIKHEHALNMVSSRSEKAQKTIMDLLHQDTSKVVRDLVQLKALLRRYRSGSRSILEYIDSGGSTYYHPYISSSMISRLSKLELDRKVLEKARNAQRFDELLLTRGLGPNTMLA